MTPFAARLAFASLFALFVLVSELPAGSTLFVARWSGGNKDIPAAIVGAANLVFVAGTSDGKSFSAVDGSVARSTWCSYTVSLAAAGGARVFDSLLCTGGDTWSLDAAVTANGDLWVVGGTDGRRLPVTKDAIQPSYAGRASLNGWGDALLFKRRSDGRLVYATYLGGAGDDVANAVLADGAAGVWVAGSTTSENFPQRGPLTGSATGGGSDAFIARIDDRGQLQSSSRFGDRGDEGIKALARATSPNQIIAVGTTTSSGGLFGSARGGVDAFVAAFDASSSGITWLRRFGKRGDDELAKVTVLRDGSIVAAGHSASRDCSGASDELNAWIVVISPGGDTVADHCIGGTGGDTIQGIAATGAMVWITGWTDSPDFPLTFRAGLAASKPEASLINFSSLKRVPMKLIPTGRPKASPIGTWIIG